MGAVHAYSKAGVRQARDRAETKPTRVSAGWRVWPLSETAARRIAALPAWYYVEPIRQEWRYRLEDATYGPFASELEARRAAIEAAEEAGSHGRPAQVLVRDAVQHWQVSWTYGETSVRRG